MENPCQNVKPSRAFTVVVNNYTEADVEAMKAAIFKKGVKYVVFQLEVGESGTPHIQGYIYRDAPCGFTFLRNLIEIPRAAFKVANGSAEQSRVYCTKETDKRADGTVFECRIGGPWEFGEMPEQGKRRDIDTVVEVIKSGATLKRIAEECPAQFIKMHRGIERLRAVLSPTRSWVVEVIVLWGPTGTGKSHRAHALCDGPYVKPAGPWWDGYDGEPHVIIDDLRGSKADDGVPIVELLRWLDRYACKVPVKGSFVELLARRVVITSNFDPEDWFYGDPAESRAALKRRITRVEHCLAWEVAGPAPALDGGVDGAAGGGGPGDAGGDSELGVDSDVEFIN